MENKQQGQDFALYSSRREQYLVFFFVCVGIIFLTYAFFFIIDFLPEKKAIEQHEEDQVPTVTTSIDTHTEIESEVQDASMENSSVTADTSPFPMVIIFDSLGKKEVAIRNPNVSSIDALDSALLSGAVRHPDSADLTETGTMFILGHSSYLPNIQNKNFQAFNGLNKLAWGDTIRVRSSDTEYVYSVERVYEAKASSAEVPIQYDTAKLVLATCNSFATKDDRFIVEAVRIDSYPLEME